MLLVVRLEGRDVVGKRLFKLYESSDAATSIVPLMRLLFALPVDADHFVILVISQVILIYFISKYGEVKVEAQSFEGWIVQIETVQGLKNILDVDFDFKSQLRRICE